MNLLTGAHANTLTHTHVRGAHTHLYSVFLFLLRVSGISSPFFIQKLSSWALWALVRLHCSVRASSMGSVACSDGLMDGSVGGRGGGHGSVPPVSRRLAARCRQGSRGFRQSPSSMRRTERRTDDWSGGVGGAISGNAEAPGVKEWHQFQDAAGCETVESSAQLKNNCIRKIQTVRL